jgi:alpha-1,6-mannosyltransferase
VERGKEPVISREELMRWRAGRAWATNVVLCLLGVGLVGLARQFVAEQRRFSIGFSGVSGWSDVLFVAAVIVVVTQPVNRATVWIVLGFAVAMRAMVLRTEPFLSTDIYRYVWDGIVQHAHISPYRNVPGDPVLSFLQARHQDVFDKINRRDYAHTIYPPAAQMIYWLVTFFSQTVQGMKVAMFGFECVTAGALIALLRLMGRRITDVLLYAWCPLLVWEIGGAGHVDAAVYCFAVLALLFRYREQPIGTGLFLGLAVMTKFYPLVLFPALYRRGDWKMPAMLLAVCAVGYGAYASVGKLVFGFLGGYAQEEGLDSGTRYFLLDYAQRLPGLHWLTKTDYLIVCVAVFAAISWWAWRYASVEPLGADRRARRPAYLRAAAMLAFALMLLFSPHYPWYIAWLAPLFALAPGLPLLAYIVSFFYLFTTSLAVPGPKMFLLNERMYGVVVTAMAVSWALRRWPAWKEFMLADGGEVE